MSTHTRSPAAASGPAAASRPAPLWGPLLTGADTARFRLWAPSSPALALEIAGEGPVAMQPGPDGWFSLDTKAAPGTRYRFVLPDGTAVPDPAARAQSGGVHGWSVLRAPFAPDAGWPGRPWEETVLWEAHAGVFGGFEGLAAELPRLKALGITALEIMPVNAFSGSRNWGYDGVLPFAPAEAYGPPEALHALVGAAHREGLMVFLDVVYNHFGPDGNFLNAYAPEFFDTSEDTPWGGAVAVSRPEVAAFFTENAVMWLGEYGMDGLRFDAVHAIGNPAFLDRMAADIRAALPGRRIHLVLENEDNDAPRLEAGFDAQWNDDFHNTLHVLLTGETEGYYADFAEAPARRLARCLAEGFVWQGETTPRGRVRGRASGHLRPTAFVNFLQNHDQTGNRAMGDRLLTLAEPAALRAATVALALMPAIPMLFMGEEQGAVTPFQFFTDFHDDLAEAVREGRRREFAHFPAFANPEARARIPDPNAPETFLRSRPVPGPDAAAWEALWRALLDLRARQIVPRLAGASALGAEAIGPRAVSAAWRMGDGARLDLLLSLDPAGAPDAICPPGPVLFTEGDPLGGAGCTVWLGAS
ncbi:malto-oligosyltrehalose trehalohydrolase (plasmid) [Paroceanicella profunda]|uniref:Malto-oligosyltrehalose trehalohydrolase n=1 Tax=Paroceanicella profunda TaxID=2579971 RepID=A0A5B8G575_9RHOB|nr:malto-oligosyltrehalose trehalohydrolase [Paroceanicella profunda]QDL94462.1 malto-oligosyltrehalose trehalohydrolase [Paroceanicella profunda]